MDVKKKKTTINLGKINYMGTGKRYPAEVDIELRWECEGQNAFIELSICGSIWNATKTDIYCGGQCLDEMKKYIHTPIFKEIYGFWRDYHLNGMHAGTPEQEAALREFHKENPNADYRADVEYLKDRGIHEVVYTGKARSHYYDNEPYKYGHDWLTQDIPNDVLVRIEEIIDNNKKGE